MKKIVKRYDKPGEYSLEIPFTQVGERREWLGIVDARSPGDYKLSVIASHKVKNTSGRITIRGVVGKNANLSVVGMIKIEKAAQEVDNFLEIRILLLETTSHATAEPKLEIEADNVKASHAASVGRVDIEQLQYLQSRGMTTEQATNVIVQGFLQEI